MKHLTLSFLLSILTLACCSQTDLRKDKIINYLIINYPDKNTENENDLIYKKENKIEPINTPILTSIKGLKIYKTSLMTSHYEYLNLNIAISIDLSNNIKVAHSPTFDNKQDEFNNSFIDVYAKNDSVKKEFISELAFIYKKITYEGDVKNITNNGNNWTAELWHGHLKWRIIKVDYENDKIIKINLLNPKMK